MRLIVSSHPPPPGQSSWVHGGIHNVVQSLIVPRGPTRPLIKTSNVVVIVIVRQHLHGRSSVSPLATTFNRKSSATLDQTTASLRYDFTKGGMQLQISYYRGTGWWCSAVAGSIIICKSFCNCQRNERTPPSVASWLTSYSPIHLFISHLTLPRAGIIKLWCYSLSTVVFVVAEEEFPIGNPS